METMVESNRVLGRKFFQEQDRMRGGPAPALCTPTYKATIGSNPVFDRAGHEAFATGFYAGFPDSHHDIQDVIATADTITVRFVIRGTHTASFFGIPASGKSVAVPAHVIMRVADGRVSELLAVFDEAGLLRQIGVLPS